jgi:nitroreductase
MSENDKFIPFTKELYSFEEMIAKSEQFYAEMNKRRSVRFFSSQTFPRKIIENIILTAGTSPSGANKQPWSYVVVDDLKLKKQIRKAAEAEEKEFYESRITEDWKKDLEHLGTGWEKPYLEIAPYLIIVFKHDYGLDSKTGAKSKNYYVNESIGISMGFLIAAIHNAGLVTLTHTPNPMNFVREILKRPKNEKPVVILPVGFPTEDAVVPNITRKNLDQILIWNAT